MNLRKSWHYLARVLDICLLTLITLSLPASAGNVGVVREDNPSIARELGIPVYLWRDARVTPQAVILAIHGITLHGGTFDAVANGLAADGYLVYAPDLRGFGRWRSDAKDYQGDDQVDFFKARADLIRLLNSIKRDNPNLPVFSLGESVGANLSLWLASVAPRLIDGVIASGTCVRRRWDVCGPLVVDAILASVSPRKQFPVAPLARRFLSESPEVVQAYLADPEMRKVMDMQEAFASLHVNRSTLWFSDNIPHNMPILVFSGVKDRMFNQDKSNQFFAERNNADCTVVSLPGRGHIQFETPYIRQDVRSTLHSWLARHTGSAAEIARAARGAATNPGDDLSKENLAKKDPDKATLTQVDEAVALLENKPEIKVDRRIEQKDE